MRLPVLRPLPAFVALAALTVAACRGPDADRWPSVQAERLDRLHRRESDERALQRVLAAAPGARASDRPAQDYLDRRLPPRPGDGVRPFRRPWQPLRVGLAVGVGDVAARAGGTVLDDRTDAAFARVELATGRGVGLDVELFRSDDDLFLGRAISDGLVPAPAAGRLSGFDVFPHLRSRFGADALRLDLETGLFLDWQRLEHARAGVERTFLSFGPRVVLEPSFGLDLSGGRAELFTRVGGDAGLTFFDESFRNGAGSDETWRLGFDVGGGLRWRAERYDLELGYRLQHSTFGELESSLFRPDDPTELQRQQWYFGVGVIF